MPAFSSKHLMALLALLLLVVGAFQLFRRDVPPSKPETKEEAGTWQLVTERVDAGLLMDIRTPGSGVARRESFDSAQDAALDHFRNRLTARGGRFVLRDRRQASLSEGSPGPPLQLFTSEGISAGKLGVELPRGDTALAPAAALWALALPSRSLYQMGLNGTVRSVVTPETDAETTLYVLVTPVDDMFMATTVRELTK